MHNNSFLRFRDCRLAPSKPPYPSDPSLQLPLGFPAAWPLVEAFDKAWLQLLIGLSFQLAFPAVEAMHTIPSYASETAAWPLQNLRTLWTPRCSFHWAFQLLGHWSRLSTRLGRSCLLACQLWRPCTQFLLTLRDCPLTPSKPPHPSDQELEGKKEISFEWGSGDEWGSWLLRMLQTCADCKTFIAIFQALKEGPPTPTLFSSLHKFATVPNRPQLLEFEPDGTAIGESSKV